MQTMRNLILNKRGKLKALFFIFGKKDNINHNPYCFFMVTITSPNPLPALGYHTPSPS